MLADVLMYFDGDSVLYNNFYIASGDIWHMQYADSVTPDEPAQSYLRATLSVGKFIAHYFPDT